MVKVTQGVQNRYFKYDSFGRLLRINQPEQEYNAGLDMTDGFNASGHWTAGFTYDIAGNVMTATDANGVTITNSYDKANRVTTRSYSGEPANQTTPTVNFYYDGKGLTSQQLPNYAKGKLTKVDNGISATVNSLFDNFGRLTESSQITDGQTYTSTYDYNFAGALVQETYPSGRVVKNEFESDGDLARIYGKANSTATENTYATSFRYTPDGRIESLKLGNGLWEKADFSSRGQVTALKLGHGLDGDLWNLGHEYGELNSDGSVDVAKNTGNIAKQTLNFNGLANPFIQTYKYDAVSRLTEARETSGTGTGAPQTWKETYGYDRYGNRTSHASFEGTNQFAPTNVTDPTIDPNTNRFNTGQGYGYDHNGNLISDAESRSITFNGDNKQTKVIENGQVVGEYYFDGEGKRVKKVTATETTVFAYSNGKLIAEYSTAPPPQNPTTSYTATDQLGSPRVLTDAMGIVVSRRDFRPFGEEVTPDGTYRTANLVYTSTDNIRQKFTGYQKDAETGLDFAEARMYENRHGRFTAVDPLLTSGKSAEPQTFNRFVYVLNNPLALTDPGGLQVGTASGDVYRNGHRFVIFAGKGSVPSGYRRVNSTIETTTLVNGVAHSVTVTPNGWTVGNRVDNQKFSAPAAAAAVTSKFENEAIRALAGGISDGWRDGWTGIGKGIGNSPAVALNGLTWSIFNGGVQASYFQGSNPLAVPMIFSYGGNARQASYGSAASTAVLLAPSFVLPAFAGSSSLSVVPAADRLPASALRFTDGLQKARLDGIADDVYLNGVQTPVDYTVIDGENYILNGNHRTFLARRFGQSVPVQEQSLPFGSWQSEDDVLLNHAQYGNPFSSGGCRYFCQNYTPPR